MKWVINCAILVMGIVLVYFVWSMGTKSGDKSIINGPEQVTGHDAEVNELEDRLEAMKQQLDAAHKKEIDNLEFQINDLKENLGSCNHKLTACKEKIDSLGSIGGIGQRNYAMERTVWFMMCLVSSVGVAFFARLYFNLKDNDRHDIIRAMAKLKHRI